MTARVRGLTFLLLLAYLAGTASAQGAALVPVSDLAYADIAELTQQSVNNVGVTLLRARERLRRDLETQGVASHGLS